MQSTRKRGTYFPPVIHSFVDNDICLLVAFQNWRKKGQFSRHFYSLAVCSLRHRQSYCGTHLKGYVLLMIITGDGHLTEITLSIAITMKREGSCIDTRKRCKKQLIVKIIFVFENVLKWMSNDASKGSN